jgi:hypothetical protein
LLLPFLPPLVLLLSRAMGDGLVVGGSGVVVAWRDCCVDGVVVGGVDYG